MPKDAHRLCAGGGDLDLTGMDIAREAVKQVLTVNEEEWRKELPGIEQHLAIFGDKLPQAMQVEYENLKKRLG